MKKYLNYDFFDLIDRMINKADLLIIKIKVQTTNSENFKGVAI